MPVNIPQLVSEMRSIHTAFPLLSPGSVEPGKERTFYWGAFSMSGHNLAGSNIPEWVEPLYPYTRTGWWNRLIPWFVLTAQHAPGDRYTNAHGSTNTRVQLRNLRLMIRRSSWQVLNTTAAPDSNRYYYDIVRSAEEMNSQPFKAIRYEPESNGGGSSHIISNNGQFIIHGYGTTTTIDNPWELTGIAVDFEMRLILDNPAGPDDRNLSRYLAHIGCDLYPPVFNFWRGNSNATPQCGYWPAVGGSAFVPVTNSWRGMGLFTYYPDGDKERGPSMPWLDDSWVRADPPPGWTTTGTGSPVAPPPPAPPTNVRRIMFFGDDLIVGDETAANGHRSIRGRVLAQLAAQGLTIDALGAQILAPAIGGDADHEGYAGARISTSSNNLTARLPAIIAAAAGTTPAPGLVVGLPRGPGIPEVIALWVGRDDYVNEPTNAADRLATLVESIRAGFPAASIVLGTLPSQQGQTEPQTSAAYAGYAALNSRIRSIAATTYNVFVADVAALAGLVSADYADSWRLLQTGADKAGLVFAAAISAALGAAGQYVIPGRPEVIPVFRGNASHPDIIRVYRGGFTPAAPTIGRTTIGPLLRSQFVYVPLDIGGSPTPTVTITGTPPAGTAVSRVAYREDFLAVGSWTSNGGAPTVTDGWIRPANNADAFLVSPSGLAVAAAQSTQVRARIRRTGAPTWEGVLLWKRTTDGGFDVSRQIAVPEPVYDAAGIATVTWTVTDALWSGTIDQLRFDIMQAGSVSAYVEVDSITVGSGIAEFPAGVVPESHVLIGTPTASGQSAITVTAANSAGSATRQFEILVQDAPTAPQIVTASLPVALLNTPYAASIEVSGTEPLQLVISGLPPGLSQSGRAIVGTRTTTATATVTVVASNAGGTDTRTYSLTGAIGSDAPQIITDTLPSGTVGVAYSAIVNADGASPVTWSIVSGSLPPGLSVLTGQEYLLLIEDSDQLLYEDDFSIIIDENALAILGTPTTAGGFGFSLQATNAAGQSVRTLVITIAGSAQQIASPWARFIR